MCVDHFHLSYQQFREKSKEEAMHCCLELRQLSTCPKWQENKNNAHSIIRENYSHELIKSCGLNANKSKKNDKNGRKWLRAGAKFFFASHRT